MQVVVRPAAAGDQTMLAAMYASGRFEELAAVQWDAATRQAFLASQAAAQERSISQQHPTAERLIVFADGDAVGRLYLVELPGAELRVLDLLLLPQSRRHGIGTRLLEWLAHEADGRRLRLSLHVSHSNPARRLYQRQGFVEVASDDVTVRLERRPS